MKSAAEQRLHDKYIKYIRDEAKITDFVIWNYKIDLEKLKQSKWKI